MKLRHSILGVLVMAAIAVAFAPAVLADEGVPINGTFTVSAMRPSASNYCADGGTPIEAQGIGSVSKLGPLFVTVKKCLTFPGGFPFGTYTGTFKMTDGNGDSVEGTYAGTQDFSQRDENGFGPFQGTLTVTEGTGSLSHARGTLSFTAVASPASVGVTAPTANLMAFYLVQGSIVSPQKQ
jgi:hypothetical protein